MPFAPGATISTVPPPSVIFPRSPKVTRRQAHSRDCFKNTTLASSINELTTFVSDALSRQPDNRDPHNVELHNLSLSQFSDGRSQLAQDYNDDPRLGPIYKDCLERKIANGYSFQNDLLYLTRLGSTTLAIPRHSPIRLTLLHDVHDSTTAGYFVFQKTYDNLRRFAYRPRISKDTRLYIVAFEKCQKDKGSQDRPAGLLQSLPIPSQRWGVVTMDFVGPLPPTVRTFNAITVFVDKLTKLAHFLSPAPLPPQLSTSPTTFFF